MSNFGSHLDSFISANVVTHMYNQFRLAPGLPVRNSWPSRGVFFNQEVVVAQLQFYPDIWLEEEPRVTTIFFITYIRPSDLVLDPGHRECKSGVVAMRLVM